MKKLIFCCDNSCYFTNATLVAKTDRITKVHADLIIVSLHQMEFFEVLLGISNRSIGVWESFQVKSEYPMDK